MQDRTFFSVFQTLFFVTGVPFALILWGMLDLPWHKAIIVAITAGIAIGMPLGYYLRGSEVRFAHDGDQSTDFNVRIAAALMDMGYKREIAFKHATTYKPTVRAGIFGDRIVINVDNFDVMVCGPKYHVDKLVKTLGM